MFYNLEARNVRPEQSFMHSEQFLAMRSSVGEIGNCDINHMNG